MICHVPCAPRDEGTRVLELLESPPKETDIDKHLSVLLTPGMLTSLPSNSALEESTLLLFNISLEHDQAGAAMSCIGFWDLITTLT